MLPLLVLLRLLSQSPDPGPNPDTDIDAFMAKVMERRDVNWDDFYNYFCRERVEFVIEGTIPGLSIQGFEREYFWYVRDGYLVRSPVTADGVTIPPDERERAELRFIERAKKREERAEERGSDRERFFGFKFEPGNYFYVGRQEFEGRDVVEIEYYPRDGFIDDDVDDDEDEKSDTERKLEAQMNKVLLVNFLIDPNEYQIVRMTLDNVGFDFLPGRLLFHLDTFESSLVMTQPFGDVWLPRDINGHGAVTTAYGNLAVRVKSEFYGYGQSNTSTKYRFSPRGDEIELESESKTETDAEEQTKTKTKRKR